MVKSIKKKKGYSDPLYSIKKIEVNPNKSKNKKPKKKSRKSYSTKQRNDKYEKLVGILIENFTNMQKVYSNTAKKFDDLTVEISKLLQLFELSAKSFAEKVGGTTSEIEKDQEFLNKLNSLLEQNKVIAKGLTLMEDKLRQKVYGNSSEIQAPRRINEHSAVPQQNNPSHQSHQQSTTYPGKPSIMSLQKEGQ
jgi:hypothetical protein